MRLPWNGGFETSALSSLNLWVGRRKAPGLSDRKSPNIDQYEVTCDRSTAGAFALAQPTNLSLTEH